METAKNIKSYLRSPDPEIRTLGQELFIQEYKEIFIKHYKKSFKYYDQWAIEYLNRSIGQKRRYAKNTYR